MCRSCSSTSRSRRAVFEGYRACVERRITFFVESAERVGSGWRVRGEVGLGPIEEGDEFTFVHHQDNGEEERLTLRVARFGGSELVIASGREVTLRRGDILGGEVTR